MFSELRTEVTRLLVSLFERGSPLETWGLVAVFLVALFVVFKLVSKAFGVTGRPIAVLLPGTALMLLAFVAVPVFWPQWFAEARWLAVFVVFLAAVLPWTGAVQGSSWISSLLLWAVALFVAVAVFYAESAISDAVHKGADNRGRYKQRNEQMNLFFDESE